MDRFDERRPLIVEQTSSDYMGETEDISTQPFTDIRQRSDLRRELVEEGNVIGNLYNEFYGKIAMNLADVIQGEAEKKFTSYLKSKGVKISKKKEEDIEAKAAIREAAMAVRDEGYIVQRRELELAFDEFVKQFQSEEDFKRNIQEGEDDFKQLWDELKTAYIQKIRESGETMLKKLDVQGVDSDEIVSLAQEVFAHSMKKEYERNRRKIAETRALLSVLDRYKNDLKGIDTFIDMAGGAGDLGIAIAETYAHDGVKVRIVDVVPALQMYSGYLKENGIHMNTRDRVEFELHPLQETKISDEERKRTAIVAKHPCGGLKEDVVSEVIQNEVPFMMLMSCCQDKMCDHVDEYYQYYADEIDTKEEFVKIAKISARTNINLDEAPPGKRDELERKRESGVDAMNILDEITANRLRRAGYQVDIIRLEDPMIPKGNVLVARKFS